MKKIRLFLTCLLLVITANLFAQNIQVSGTVTDAGTGEPIAFASLQIKGTSFGTTTDDFGKYTISAPSDGVLIISFVGYQNSEVAINGKSVVDVVLSIDAES